MEEAHHFGIMQVDDDYRIVDFEEKPENPKPIPDEPGTALASMGIYVFSTQYLREQLINDAQDRTSNHDFGKDIIPRALEQSHQVMAYKFHNPHKGKAHYWRDVGTIDALFEANLEIVAMNPQLDVYDPEWPIYTYHPQLPPAHFISGEHKCELSNSMASGGCVVNSSTLKNTVLFSNVHIGSGCELENAVIMPGCEIGENSRLKNVFLDNSSIISRNSVIGEDREKDSTRFEVTEKGVVVVNRRMLGQGVQYIPGVVPSKMKSQ